MYLQRLGNDDWVVCDDEGRHLTEAGHAWSFKMTAPREWGQKRTLKNYRMAADVIEQLEHLTQIKHYSQAYMIEQLITDAYLDMSKGVKMPHLDINTRKVTE